LDAVGVRPAQLRRLDAWTGQMLDLLDAHFAQQPFLFGARPGLGDFALAGSMVAHLGRDPWPVRMLIAPRPPLQAWIARMADPAALPPGPGWLPGDTLAPTLDAVMRLLFQSFVPMLAGINRQVLALLPGLAAGQPLPRALADVEMPMGDGVFCRAAIPYTLWMVQRTLDLLAAMPPADQMRVQDWLARVGGDGLLVLKLPRLRRVGLQVAAA
jgi:hypothetical protein